MNPSESVQETIQFALESTFYLEPEKTGLFLPEIHELCERFAHQKGETDDALDLLQSRGHIEMFWGKSPINLTSDYPYLSIPFFRFKKDPRNFDLMRATLSLIDEENRKQGARQLSLSIPFIVSRISEKTGLRENDVRVCLRLLARYKLFEIADDTVQKPRNLAENFVTNIERSTMLRRNEQKFYQVKNTVSEILSRRSSSKTIATDPLDAFAELFPYLGSEAFSGWWNIQVYELRSLDHKRSCNLTLVASASLCEGALAFVAASKIKHGLTLEKKLPENPTQWNLSALIDSACTGSRPLVDGDLKKRLADLNESRQVIHPGRFISTQSRITKVPDIRPEQAEAAVGTVKMLLRSIIDWVLAQKAGKFSEKPKGTEPQETESSLSVAQ